MDDCMWANDERGHEPTKWLYWGTFDYAFCALRLRSCSNNYYVHINRSVYREERKHRASPQLTGSKKSKPLACCIAKHGIPLSSRLSLTCQLITALSSYRGAHSQGNFGCNA